MKTNQAFTILSGISGPHVARIIIESVPNPSRLRLWHIACQLKRGMPVAKIIHNKWFYGLRFYTNKYTLDPRPDTETLVDAVLQDYAGVKKFTIADIGTGTGCIICAIVKNSTATGVAIDKLRRALCVARKNVKSLGLGDKISVQHGDFRNPQLLPENYADVIVSNPPYIAYGDKRVNDGALHDPKIALFAKHNGLAAYEQIAQNAKNWLKNDGKIYLEIGIGMAESVKQIFNAAGWAFVKSVQDLGGITRVMVFQK